MRLSRSFLAACIGALASVASAGVVDPAHRLEWVGPAAQDAVAILEAPGTGHALVLRRSGDVLLVRGRGLGSKLVAHVDVDTACAAHGLLDAAWDPAAPGQALVVSHVAQATRFLTVSRIDVASGAVTRLYDTAAAAGCSNVGGALAFASDGTLLLATGDWGNPASAGQLTPKSGKILRMRRDGGVPAAPLAPNPLPPNPYFFAMGLRNPERMTTDGTTGRTWFLDVGAGDEGELNLVGPNLHYGWDAAGQMGPRATTGLEDPFMVWGPGTGPIGLVSYRGENLDGDLVGRLLVATRGTGDVSVLTLNEVDRSQSTEELLFTRDATGPQTFVDMRAFRDGFLYLLGEAGEVHRLLSTRGPLREPSSLDSMLPLTVRKSATGFEVALERMPGVETYGVQVGDVRTLTAGYTHVGVAPVSVDVDPDAADATTRLPLDATDLGVGDTYFLVSARRTCTETGLGRGSFGDRPSDPRDCSVAVLGRGSHSIDDVVVTEIARVADGLMLPRDLAFHPDVPGELWVVNQLDHSAVIIFDAGKPTQTTSKRAGPGGEHFFSQPSALAFGPGTGFCASAQEEDDYTQGPPPAGTPRDFMGPTLWIADSAVFEGGHDTHYDMLHNSPNATGIAWEQGNAYWVNDGYHGSLTRYDFAQDHGPGGAYHGDGIITRYAEGEIGYVADVGSHVVFDHDTGLVIAADTGNNRLVVLDPTTGTDGGRTLPNYDGCTQTKVNGAATWTLVDGGAAGMVEPSGLELHDGLLFVSDHATSRILAFTMDGELVDWLDTGFPPLTLMGIAFDPADGNLYVVDTLLSRVLRIAPR